MPIYEFECQSCGNEFERIQSFSDTSVPSCPACLSLQVVRRLGRPAIHFKGSGWYVTDSKNSSKSSSSDDRTPGADSNDKTSDEKKTEKAESKETTPIASSQTAN